MYSRVLTTAKKDEVLSYFSQKNGKLHLVIATTAFGMGVDCPDIHRIIHWGMPSTLEESVQETGRSGQDGEPSIAIVYQGKGLKNATDKALRNESNTLLCRRQLLLNDF